MAVTHQEVRAAGVAAVERPVKPPRVRAAVFGRRVFRVQWVVEIHHPEVVVLAALARPFRVTARPDREGVRRPNTVLAVVAQEVCRSLTEAHGVAGPVRNRDQLHNPGVVVVVGVKENSVFRAPVGHAPAGPVRTTTCVASYVRQVIRLSVAGRGILRPGVGGADEGLDCSGGRALRLRWC